MPRPRKPANESIRRIYDCLISKSKCYGEIVDETELHGNTVGSTLNFLVKKELVKRMKKGHKTMYELLKTEPPHIGWKIPWIVLTMAPDDWRKKWKDVNAELKKSQDEMKAKRFEEKLGKFLYQQLIIFNPELTKLLDELGMDDVPLRRLLEHRERPYCLDCLKESRRWNRTRRIGAEYVCEKCGIATSAELFEEYQIPEIHERLIREWLEETEYSKKPSQIQKIMHFLSHKFFRD